MLKFVGVVDQGKLIISDRHGFDNYIASLSGEVEVSVQKRQQRKDRSNKQNRYYYGVICGVVSSETGYDKDEVHEIMKSKFLKSYKTIKGKEYRYIKSTTMLSTKEFEEYMDQCRQWAAMELSLYIPEPLGS